jgi:hypothetical protein
VKAAEEREERLKKEHAGSPWARLSTASKT